MHVYREQQDDIRKLNALSSQSLLSCDTTHRFNNPEVFDLNLHHRENLKSLNAPRYLY
jgi:hypothetical protein